MTLHSIKMSLAALTAAVALSACDNAALDQPATDIEAEGWHSCPMRFETDKPSFGLSSRADDNWQAGNTVYINFTLANGQSTYGNAVRKADGTWTVNYNGRLSAGVISDCQVFYIDGEYVSNELKTEFELTPANAVYADRNAKYSYANGELVLSATLEPVTSRIRFINPSTHVTTSQMLLRGIEYISSLNIQTLTVNTVNTNRAEESPLTCDYGPNSDNTYLYGTFPAAGVLRMLIDSYLYTFDMPTEVTDFMAVGQSGYINIPTPTAHNGWLIGQVEVSGTGTPVQVGTYTSAATGTGSYNCTFTITDFNFLRVSLSNIEQYGSALTVQIYRDNTTLVHTIAKSNSSLSPFDEDVSLTPGSYTARVSTTSRRCTFTFYLVNNGYNF